MKPFFLAVDQQTTNITLLRGKISDAKNHPDFRHDLTVVAEPDLSEAWYFYHNGWRSFSGAGLTIAPEWYSYALQTYIHLEQGALLGAQRLRRAYWVMIALNIALSGLLVYLVIRGIIR